MAAKNVTKPCDGHVYRLVNLLQCQPGDPLLAKDLEAVKALLELGVPPGYQDVEQSKTWRLPGEDGLPFVHVH
jgi:hypothetical protein